MAKLAPEFVEDLKSKLVEERKGIKLREELFKLVANENLSTLLKIKESIPTTQEFIPESLQKTAKHKTKNWQTYDYSYSPVHDTLTETVIGKNTSNSLVTKDELLHLAAVFVPLINSKGNFQSNEDHYKNSEYSKNRLRVAFRMCLQLGVMKKTYKTGRIYSATGGKTGFLAALERAWEEKVHTL